LNAASHAGAAGLDAAAAAYCVDRVRRYDDDRYLTTLFAPAPERLALNVLYAFNLEVARTREAVSEPLLGEIRLQWWREAIAGIYDGTPRRHAVVEPLAAAIAAHRLSRTYFDRLIDARAADLADEAPADLPTLVAYAEGTSATLAALALEVAGVEDEAADRAGRHVGIAWALTGLLRAVPFHARARRQYLPAELMRQAGARSGDLFELRSTPALAEVARAVAEEARRHLAEARKARAGMPRAALPALLTGVLADRYLDRIARAGHDLFGPPVMLGRPGRQLHLAWRAARGRY